MNNILVLHDPELLYLKIMFFDIFLIYFLIMYTKMYVLYILIIIRPLYVLFSDVYNYYYYPPLKFIVVSKNKNNKFKVHTEPISLTKALEIQKKLEYQYNQKFYKGEAFIMKFIQFK